MNRLVGVNAHEHQSAFLTQFHEKIQHETDVAVLSVELRFIEQMYHGVVAICRFQHETWPGALEMAYLVGLVVVNGQSVSLIIFYIVNIVTVAIYFPPGGLIAAGDQFKQGRLSRTVWPHHSNDRRFFDGKVNLDLKCHLPGERSPGVDFA